MRQGKAIQICALAKQYCTRSTSFSAHKHSAYHFSSLMVFNHEAQETSHLCLKNFTENIFSCIKYSSYPTAQNFYRNRLTANMFDFYKCSFKENKVLHNEKFFNHLKRVFTIFSICN